MATVQYCNPRRQNHSSRRRCHDEIDDGMESAPRHKKQRRAATEGDLVSLRRAVYLTLMSSAKFEEAGHKLLALGVERGEQAELCRMIVQCCRYPSAYSRFYGMLAQRLCSVDGGYRADFARCFDKVYSEVHRLEMAQIRNVACFFAHLVATGELSWRRVLGGVRLTVEDTTSSSRVFLKVLVHELAAAVGVRELADRLGHASLRPVFPCAQFAVNFFSSIGLGSVAKSLRVRLQS